MQIYNAGNINNALGKTYMRRMEKKKKKTFIGFTSFLPSRMQSSELRCKNYY